MSELKPCPFCGGTELMVVARTCDRRTPYNPADTAYPRVWCKCGAEVAGANWGEKPTAIAAWNRRAPDAADKALIADLAAELEEALDGWEEGAQYKGEYLRDKHGDAEGIAKGRAVLARMPK